MAVQHLVAFSGSVVGAAIAAGSPYGCGALPGGHVPEGKCYYGGTDVQASIQYLRWRFRNGLIDDPVHLQSTPIVLFNGKRDWTVYPKVMRETFEQLRAFVDREKLERVFDTSASHVWSLDHGLCFCGQCALFGSGVCCDVNDCAYDLSGDMLQRSYGPLLPRVQARPYFSWIPQLDFIPPPSSSWSHARMAEWAIAYVPTGCQVLQHNCRVHVNYHGCIADKWPQRLEWVQNLDLNEYGEANNIIVLYPQASGDATVGKGCWNWGFPRDDHLFDTKFSVQLQTVANMINALPRILRQAVQLPMGVGPPPPPPSSAKHTATVPPQPPRESGGEDIVV